MYQEPLSAVQPIAMVAWALPWTVAATLPTASTSLLLLDYLDGSWPWSIPSPCPELQQPQLPAGSSGVLSCLGTACRGNPQLRNPVSLSSQHTHSILQGMVWSNNSEWTSPSHPEAETQQEDLCFYCSEVDVSVTAGHKPPLQQLVPSTRSTPALQTE